MMKLLTLFLTTLMVLPVCAMAQEQADHVGAELISAYTGTGNLPTIDMALDVDLKDNFYTYWRMAGDNGVAPVFDWTGSENVKDIAVSWPIPKRFTLFDMNSFGYEDGVLFPLSVTPMEPGKAVTLKLKLNLMVCHDICIPQTVTMMRVFGAGDATKSENFAKIEHAKKQLPAKENKESLGIDAAILSKDAVVVTAFAKDDLKQGTDLIVETSNAMLTGIPEIIPPASKGGKSVLKINAPDGVDLTKELFGKSVTILLIHNGEAVEKTVTF